MSSDAFNVYGYNYTWTYLKARDGPARRLKIDSIHTYVCVVIDTLNIRLDGDLPCKLILKNFQFPLTKPLNCGII